MDAINDTVHVSPYCRQFTVDDTVGIRLTMCEVPPLEGERAWTVWTEIDDEMSSGKPLVLELDSISMAAMGRMLLLCSREIEQVSDSQACTKIRKRWEKERREAQKRRSQEATIEGVN